MPPVAAIAIDAAEHRFLRRHMDAGRLPHPRALADRAARFELRGAGPYRSDLAWVQFLSGRRTAIEPWTGLLDFDPATYAVHGHGTLETVPFYAVPGRRTIAFDLPGSVIDPAVEGIQVTGWGAHSPQWWRASAPAGLLSDLDERYGTNPALGNEFDITWHEPTRLAALADACHTGTRRRKDILEGLLRSDPTWDLVVTAVSEVHTMGRHLWFGVDEDHPLHGVAPTSDEAGARFTETLADADEAIGRLVAQLPPDAAVVVFALPTFDDALIRVNLAGREVRGVVARDGYQRACADATDFVRQLTDARTGRPAVAEVIPLRGDDPYDPSGPGADLVVRWEGAPDALVHPTLGMVGPVPHARTGGHSVRGFAYVAGPGISAGDRGERPAADLTPTVLDLMGADTAGVDGTSLLVDLPA